MTHEIWGGLGLGSYTAIAADPGWSYKDANRPRGGVKGRYRTDPNEEIKRLPVLDLAARDCLLFMWCTNWVLSSGLAGEVVSAWGFEARTVHTWVKIAKNGNLKIGGGDYGRNCTEHFIVAKRGHPDLGLFCSAPAIPTVHFWDYVPSFSAKPPEFFVLVNRVCPGTKIELHARTARPGWDRWGDQAPEVQL